MNSPLSVAWYFVTWTAVVAVCIASTEPPIIAALWAVVILCVTALAMLSCAVWESRV